MSLVELIVVMGAIVVLVALGAPALMELARGQGMKRAVSEVGGLLEQARIEAMATSTWTWVGLAQRDPDAPPELLAVLIASKDGTNNMDADNLRIISRPVRIENVRVLSELTEWAGETGSVPLTGSSFSFSETVAGESVSFTDTVVGFSPRGEATLSNNTVPPWIEIGLVEMRGAVEIPDRTASIRVSGFSGQQDVSY